MALMTDPAPLLPQVIAIAREAGRATLPFYVPGSESARKPDGSPVTAADHAAEAVILPALAALTPDIPVISEEAFARGQSPDLSAGPFWLVDPLDGTKEFLKRNGEFTVNIALIDGGVPVLGVVDCPVTEECFAGAAGRAIRRVPGAEAPIRVRAVPADGYTVLSSRSHADNPALEQWLRDKPVAGRAVCGSSVKFCRIAAGQADLYPRFGPTMEWDTAAGHAVLLAAGGDVVTPDGRRLAYGKPGFANPHFIAYGGRRP